MREFRIIAANTDKMLFVWDISEKVRIKIFEASNQTRIP